MAIQKRNLDQVDLLKPYFIGRREFYEYGGGLATVGYQHLEGGGSLIYDFYANRPSMPTWIGDVAWTYGGITFASFEATSRGGPYGIFNGQSSVIYYPDASWQEVSDGTLGTDETLLVWHWARTTTIASSQVISAKWDTNGPTSWILYYNAGQNDFSLGIDAGAGIVSVTSTENISADTWCFVAGYWQASTLQRIFVAEPTENALNITSLVAGVPASAQDVTVPLSIGAGFNVAPALWLPWSGYIGIGRLEFGVPATAINGYVTRLFHQTAWYYRA